MGLRFHYGLGEPIVPAEETKLARGTRVQFRARDFVDVELDSAANCCAIWDSRINGTLTTCSCVDPGIHAARRCLPGRAPPWVLQRCRPSTVLKSVASSVWTESCRRSNDNLPNASLVFTVSCEFGITKIEVI